MSEDGGSKIHPDLLKAQQAAEYIEKHGFDDLGAKTADLRVKWIVEALKSEDESDREDALKDIERFKNDWLSRNGAGTAGSILTRLMALGIIDEMPTKKSE